MLNTRLFPTNTNNKQVSGVGDAWLWVKTQIIPTVNIRIPTKIGSKMGGAPMPKWGPIGFEPWPHPRELASSGDLTPRECPPYLRQEGGGGSHNSITKEKMGCPKWRSPVTPVVYFSRGTLPQKRNGKGAPSWGNQGDLQPNESSVLHLLLRGLAGNVLQLVHHLANLIDGSVTWAGESQ